jgi:hypothetical protein
VTQLQKNLALLGGLVVLAGALGLYAYLGVMKKEEREAERKQVSEKLFSAHSPGERSRDGGAPPEPVFTSIVVKAKGDSTTVEKKGDDWWVTAPLSAKADKSAVEQLLSHLQTGKVKSTVEENPTEADLAKYGLDKPSFTITAYAYMPDAKGEGANDPSRRREVNLYGGIENTFDGSVYLRRGGEKPVYAVDGSSKYFLDKSTFDLRDKDVLAIDEASLKQIDFKSKANRYVLERTDAKNWQLTSPKRVDADSSTVTSLLSAFRNNRALAFLTDSSDERKRTGVNTPAADVTFSPTAGDKVRIHLATAKVGSDQKAFALRQAGQEAILAEVPLAAVTALDKSPNDLRDKSVLTFNRDEVARVTFSPGGGAAEIIVEKASADAGPSEEWRVTAPLSGPAKKWKLSSVLWSLSSLKASSIADENPKDWGKYGVSVPSRAVTLADHSGKVLAKLQVGKEVKGNAKAVYVRGSRNSVLEIDAARLGELPSKIEDVIEPSPQRADGGPSGVSSN